MKLRIKGNSVRLRVTQSEVDTLKSGQPVEERTDFIGETLSYSLLISDQHNAQFKDHALTVHLNNEVLRTWFQPEEVSMRFKVGDTDFLIEKDFACLITRDGEDDSDAFPNPLAKTQ